MLREVFSTFYIWICHSLFVGNWKMNLAQISVELGSRRWKLTSSCSLNLRPKKHDLRLELFFSFSRFFMGRHSNRDFSEYLYFVLLFVANPFEYSKQNITDTYEKCVVYFSWAHLDKFKQFQHSGLMHAVAIALKFAPLKWKWNVMNLYQSHIQLAANEYPKERIWCVCEMSKWEIRKVNTIIVFFGGR